MTCDLIHSAIVSTHLKRMSTLDSSWVVSAGANGLAAHNSPSWLGLYLSVCKLLDLSLALPAHKLPQFQMYRWAFVSEGMENNNVDGLEANQLQNTKTPHSITKVFLSHTITYSPSLSHTHTRTFNDAINLSSALFFFVSLSSPSISLS